MKKLGISMNICMGVTISFFLSLVNTLSSGHFTVPGFISGFIFSTIVSVLIGFIVPIHKIESSLFNKKGLQPQSLKARLIGSCLSDCIYTPLMSLTMVLFARMQMKKGGAPAEAIPPFVPMFLKSLIISLIVAYIIIFIVQPVFLKTFMKKYGAPEGGKPENNQQ